MATIPYYRVPVEAITLANVCAEACWYGINFENLKVNQLTSDEGLLNYFAEPMYKHGRNVAVYDPDIFTSRVDDLITVCGLRMLRLKLHNISFNGAILTIKNQIYPEFDSVQTTLTSPQSPMLPSIVIRNLSRGMVTQPHYHQIILASRILFFNVPNIKIYNISSALAKNLQMKGQPFQYHVQYQEKMDLFFLQNRTQLSAHVLPSYSVLDKKVWSQIKQTDWWQRRVLDLALLIHFKCVFPHADIEPRVLQERAIRLNLQGT